MPETTCHCRAGQQVTEEEMNRARMEAEVLRAQMMRMVKAADSLRGLLYANHKNLGLKNPPSNENNFLHASKSIYESLVERSRWTVMPLKKDPFGNRLVESQTPLRKISWWITNPVLLDQDLPKKIRGKRASELLYGLGSDEAYHASMSILSRKLTSIK